MASFPLIGEIIGNFSKFMMPLRYHPQYIIHASFMMRNKTQLLNPEVPQCVFPASPQTVSETEKMSQIAFYFLLDAAFLASSLLQMKQSCPYKIRISTMHVRNTSQALNYFY